MPIFSYEYISECPIMGQDELHVSQVQMESISDLMNYFDQKGIDFIGIERLRIEDMSNTA